MPPYAIGSCNPVTQDPVKCDAVVTHPQHSTSSVTHTTFEGGYERFPLLLSIADVTFFKRGKLTAEKGITMDYLRTSATIAY